jgi:hypothetical protein
MTDTLDTKEFTTTLVYNDFDTTVDVIFIDTPKPICDCQQKTFDNFNSNQNTFTNDILNKIFVFYKASYSDYKEGWIYGNNLSDNKLSDEGLEKYLPIPTIADKLKKYISPLTIYIPDANKCKDGLIGISFDCSWDIKNGLGVLIKDWQVAEVGVSEISFIYF